MLQNMEKIADTSPFRRGEGRHNISIFLFACQRQAGTFSLQIPLTMSDILLSSTGSPGIFAVLPGKGGKFDASKSNFGVGVFVSAEG